MRLLPLLVLAAAASAQTAKLPSFDEYKVSEVFKGMPAEPRLTTPFAREFRSQIRESASKGPNFAGKFSIAQWGCGAGCIQMAVIDEQTGAVYRGPFTTLDFSAGLHYADLSDSSHVDSFEPLGFRKESRMLAVRGCLEEDQSNCALFFYEWDGKKFTQLHKLMLPPALVP